MPFDPTRPHDHSTIEADELRDQFNGLRSEYTGLIDAIPDGPPGPKGDKGDKGDQGEIGPPGPAFGTAVVDATNTLDHNENASVVLNLSNNEVHFTFGIPRGVPGLPGEVTTTQMNDAIALAINGTAQNPASFPPFTGTFSDPVTQAEMQAFAAYVESFRQFMSR